MQAAADVGFVFRGRDRNILRLQVPFHDELDEYELLNVLEFSSARKRMSVVIRKLDDDGKIFLLVKGADNVIFERLADGNDQIKAKTMEDLSTFASDGLRTLCLGYRILDEKEFADWSKEYHEATVSLENRDKMIDECSAKIEHSLELLGATAIEDKLQDGVPETIADLKRAGIRVFVLTGLHHLEPATLTDLLISLRLRRRQARDRCRDRLHNQSSYEGFESHYRSWWRLWNSQ